MKRKRQLDDFCVFILSHENPYDVRTLKTLERCNYTGRWYIVLDSEDRKIEHYKHNFGEEHVLIFSKDEVAKKFDEMDIEGNRGVVVYARNVCFDLAEKVGVRYFCELDDDYLEFRFRFAVDNQLRGCWVKDIDAVFSAMVDLLNSSDNIYSVAMAQMGDFIGGYYGSRMTKFRKDGLLRKAMNSFVCDVEKPFVFHGRINEDVNTYCLDGSRGKLFFTFLDVALNQIDTQQRKQATGMTEAYSEKGTYNKSFYTVMCCPSFVKINMLMSLHPRIHHYVYWENAVPKIISDKWRK